MKLMRSLSKIWTLYLYLYVKIRYSFMQQAIQTSLNFFIILELVSVHTATFDVESLLYS